MTVTSIPNDLSRRRECSSGKKAIYYRDTTPLVIDSDAARANDAMASITNLEILYRMYDTPKYIITLTVRVSLTSRVTIETGQKAVPRQFTRNDYTFRENYI